MDCSILDTSIPGVVMVSTTDFFYPLVDDPYTQGQIACANVLSDMYAVGARKVDNMLMILASSTQIPASYRTIVTVEMVRGFNDWCKKAGTKVTGGQSVMNPWPILGGVAQSVMLATDVITPENARAGDVMVLTKPLGTQLAVNLHQWLDQPKWWDQVKHVIDAETVIRAYNVASASMKRLNMVGAQLMHKHNARAATDVTGFGILGHANNLAQAQKAKLTLRIDSLPVIKGTIAVDRVLKGGALFNLATGYSAETSGGLLMCMAPADADAFCRAIHAEEGWKAFVVGQVIEGDNTACLSDTVEFIEV
ncbi:selenide, water dikinase [Sphaeroforma arctica JP610]|uniref:Selenide, water dikinase n=1 Tax=Sphaeroforma arctica JP610 TaxID=667725 RepID=A0A0L0FNH8_9EUKA|nr:selenide, water dikinase [Sphaeroforma arctica JP610]KNC78274.1 selenide, water dikinase [Sphaeroforma arctica JP610]|eukprot:XP_014152176.1 selenide, water dikinase [Sphaeroforma arctica JP610]